MGKLHDTTPTIRVLMTSLLNSISFCLSGSEILLLHQQLQAVLVVYRNHRPTTGAAEIKLEELQHFFELLTGYAEKEKAWRKWHGYSQSIEKDG